MRRDLMGLLVSWIAISVIACASTEKRGPGLPQTSTQAVTSPSPDAGRDAALDDVSRKHRNTIRWSTASEADNLGFDVYRAEQEAGPFEKINDALIEGSLDSDDEREYAFVDDQIDPFQEYWYFVESISLSGQREPFTPIGRAGPKLSPPSSP